MSTHPYTISGVTVYLTPSQVESIIYNAATLVAKATTTSDPLSLQQRLQEEADDMVGVFEECDLEPLVAAVAREMELSNEDEEAP